MPRPSILCWKIAYRRTPPSYPRAATGAVVDNSVIWTIDELTVNLPQLFTLTVAVDLPLADQTQIFNTTTLTGDTQSVTAEFESTVKSEAVLELVKTASAEQVSPGDHITYLLTFRNVGNAIAQNLFIEDALPDNTTFVSASDNGQLADGVVTWVFPSIVPGTAGEVTLTVRADSPLPDGTRIYNVASADADLTRAAVDDATVFIDSSPILELDKIADKAVANPGDLITYTLNVANSGNANAVNAVLEDTVPENTVFESATGNFTLNGSDVTWAVDSIPVGAVGAVSLVVRIDSPLATGTSILNSATLSADNAQSTTSEVQTQIESAASLTLDKIASSPNVMPGDLLTYTLTGTNTGNANATNTVLTDVVPDNTTFLSAGGGGQLNGDEVTWNLGTLPVGSPATVTMTVMVDSPLDDGTILVNNARILADATGGDTALVEVTVDSAPVLTIDKGADKSVLAPGDLVTYTLDLQNTGNSIARSVTVFDLLPLNTSFVSASPPATVDARNITWELGDIVPGESPSLLLTVQADAPLDNGTIIFNTASVGADNANPSVSFHQATIQSSPTLQLSKVADRNTVQPGEQVTFSLTYANAGNADAQNVVLSDPIPALMSFVSATGGGAVQGGSVVWDFGELGAGDAPGEVTVTFMVAAPPLDNGTPITNTATLDASNGLSVVTSATVTVQSAPELALLKSTQTPLVSPGEQVTFLLEYANQGNENANECCTGRPGATVHLIRKCK